MNKDNKIKLIIGSHGSGKSDWIYNRFLDISRNDKDKSKIDLNKKIYLVVPEQDTNEKQRAMMKKANEIGYGAGILNIDVVSFDRIAHNVFSILNIEPIKENVIDDDMKTMILSLVLSKLAKANRLRYCNKMVNRVGFARKLTQVVSEFYAYSVSDEDIDKVINDKKSDVYRDKLSDFKTIFDEFKKVLIDMHFSIKEDKYDLLEKRVSDVNIFKDAIVGFDGFTGFTPVQLSIFRQIAEVAKEVYVTVDYRDPRTIKTFRLDSDIEDTDLFYLSKEFIRDIAKVSDVKTIDELLCDESIKEEVYKYASDKKSDLRCIERNIYKFDYSGDNVGIKNIDYYVADNIREEIENVIQQIINLVRNEGYKYSDIKIVVPKILDYRDYMIKYFGKYNIPLFIDDSEAVLNSPYIETIRAAIDVLNYNFSYDTVMRYINSGMVEKNRAIYEFDNFILKHAIRGYDRYKVGFDKIRLAGDDKEKIYSVKSYFIDPLLTMYEKLKDNRCIKDYIVAISDFIKDANIDEKYEELYNHIEELKKQDSSYNRISAVLKYSKEVIENVIEDLSNLEKYKEKNESEYIVSNITIEEFRRMLDAGISNKTLKSIPFSLDQVVVGDIMRSRFDNPKVEFFIGLNQSSVPAKSSDVNLIDDAIRELFASNVKELSQTTIETTLNQRFYTYLVLTNPTERLILSYTNVNSEGESDMKSQVLIMIENLFGKDENNEPLLKPNKVNPDSFNFYNYNDLISYVALNMQDITKYGIKDSEGKFVYEFSDELERRIVKSKEILKYLKKDKDYNLLRENVFSQPNYYKDVRLNKNINDDLLKKDGKEFKGSATSIENFNACPFKFFMEHTLKIKENKEYRVEPYDIGNLAHSVFEKLFKDKNIIEKDKVSINKLVDETIDESYNLNDVFTEFNKIDKDFIGVNKLEYIKSRIKELIHHSTNMLIDMAKASKFKTDDTEYSFEYDINEKDDKLNSLVVTGKIDRIDICDIDGTTYVNVVDYKSGKKEKELDLKEVESGTNIQLTLYIDYCINHKYKLGNKNPIFAGSFYFWVSDAKSRYEKFNSDEASKLSMKEELKSQMGYNGVLTSDDATLELIYDKPQIKKNSRGSISSVNLNNGYKLDGKYIDKNDLDELINKMHNKINDTIDNINNGVITAKPHNSNICKNCPYSNICRKEQLILDEGNSSEV